jgi:hypothetical protein
VGREKIGKKEIGRGRIKLRTSMKRENRKDK